MTNRLIEMYEIRAAYIFQCHCLVAYNLSVSHVALKIRRASFVLPDTSGFSLLLFFVCFLPFVSSKTKTIVKSPGLEVELFRFRFFIHQVLQQGKCLESGKHTNISKQQH